MNAQEQAQLEARYWRPVEVAAALESLFTAHGPGVYPMHEVAVFADLPTAVIGYTLQHGRAEVLRLLASCTFAYAPGMAMRHLLRPAYIRLGYRTVVRGQWVA